MGCQAATLQEVLTSSKIVFVVAGVTAQNQGLLNREAFLSMPAGGGGGVVGPGAAGGVLAKVGGGGLVLVSGAAVVDFEAMLDVAATGHIRVATDVFPQEPLPLEHRARKGDNLLLSPHQAGALAQTLAQIGVMVTADAELIARGLPPCLCKIAQPETVTLWRSQPVAHS